MAVALTLKLSSMAGCSPALLGSSSTSKTPPPRLVSSRATPSYFTRFSCSSSSLALSAFFLSWTKNKVPMSLCTVAKTSNLAWQDEEEVSGWRGREEAEEEIQEEEGFAGVETEEEGFPEPPAEAKLFVGNLPYDVDSEKLAHLFEKGGMVEISEVIYSRETGQSRGFGFVTMSTVEEAKNAVEMFHRYDLNGRLLTVNTAAPRGSLPEKPPPGDYEPSFRIYVGNLPWQVDCAGLEQIFSEHGKVLNARVVYDRETGRSRGFGFVSMSSQSELDDAIAALDGQSLDGRSIRVCVAEERPRRGSF